MSEAALETPAIEATGDKKRRLDPGFARNMKILGGALLVAVVAVVMMLMLGRPGNNSQQASPSDLRVNGQTAQNNTMTPAMQEMLREQHQVESAAAAKAGQSYIPPDAVGGVEPLAPQPQQPPMQPSAYQQTSQQNQGGQISESDQRRREGLERQLQALLGGAGGEAGEVRVRISASTSNGQKDGSASNSAAASTASSSSNVQTGRQIVPGLEIVAATLSSDLSVPAGASAYASATIRSGALNGAFLVGTARVVDEALVIQFTKMRFGTQTFDIDAIVLDQQTAANAVAGSVDRRILQRYVLPISLAMAQGFFAAKANPGTAAVAIGQDVAVTTPPSSTEQARAAGVSESLKIAGQQVQTAAQSPIVISAFKDTSVGLLFRSAVYEGAKQ